MKKIFIFALVVLVALAVLGGLIQFLFDDGYRKPIFYYEGQFDVRNISGVENYMVEVANKWDFELFEKGRAEMSLLSMNKPAFFNAFYSDGELVLVITNVGYASMLTLSLQDSGEMPIERLEVLANEVRNGLQSKFNIKLNVVDP